MAAEAEHAAVAFHQRLETGYDAIFDASGMQPDC
jgi:hypothetical protein